MVDKTEIQKLRAEIETARGEVVRKRRKPAAPKAGPSGDASPKSSTSEAGMSEAGMSGGGRYWQSEGGASGAVPPGPVLPGLEGVDLEAMLTKAEDALANLDEDISRHPRLAVLGALAVGLIIGSLLSR